MSSDAGTNILQAKEDSLTGTRCNVSLTEDRDGGTVEHVGLLQHTTEQTRATTSNISAKPPHGGERSSGYTFGDTYVGHNGVAILGDVDNRMTNTTTIYAVRDKRSRLEALAMSLLSGAAGGAIVRYSAASCHKDDGNAQNTTKVASTTTRTPSPDPWRPEMVSLIDTSSLPALPSGQTFTHSTPLAFAKTTSDAPLQYQLNCCERVYPERHVTRRSKSLKGASASVNTAALGYKKVLILRLRAARTTRYHFLIQKLTSHCDVVIVDNIKKALNRINNITQPLDVVLVYDQSILTASEDPSSLAGQFLTSLARFTSDGGTTVFGPHFDKSIQCRSIVNLFIGFWALPPEIVADSSSTQFLVSSALARRIAAALSYYFRAAVKQLRTSPDNSVCITVTNHIGDGSTLRLIQGPRRRSASERFLAFVEHGKGKVGFLGKVGSKQDTCRIVFAMLDLPW